MKPGTTAKPEVFRREKLKMMVIPRIFVPEFWSFTFYEGPNMHPASTFKDKTLAELGFGNGWISIAVAEKWLPLMVWNYLILTVLRFLDRFEYHFAGFRANAASTQVIHECHLLCCANMQHVLGFATMSCSLSLYILSSNSQLS